jgi:hypothetical protein
MKRIFNFLRLKPSNNGSKQSDKESLVRLSKRGAAAIDEVGKGNKVRGVLVTDPRITCIISQKGIKLFLNNKPL